MRLHNVAGIALLVILSGVGTAQEVDENSFSLGSYRAVLWPLEEPAGVAVDHAGRIYVAERAASRLCVFDRTGSRLAQVGRFGRGEGEFVRPEGVAVAGNRVLVTDSGNHRVQVFRWVEDELTWERSVGERGTGKGELCRPQGVAAGEGQVWVADTRNDRVVGFSVSGALAGVAVGFGDSRPSYRRPVGIAVGPEEGFFVTDGSQHVVREKDGRLADRWGGWGEHPGMLAWPRGVAVAGGRVFVADAGNHRISVFDAGGKHLADWGNHVIWPHEGRGKIHYPDGIAVAAEQGFAVIAESFENRCQIVAALKPGATPPERQPAWMRTQSSHFGGRCDVTRELLVIPERDTQQVRVFDLRTENVIEVSKFGGYGSKPGKFTAPVDVKLFEAGGDWKVAVLDTGNENLQIFGLDHDSERELKFLPAMARLERAVSWTWLNERVPSEAQKAWPLAAAAVTRDKRGRWYLLDDRNGCIWVFDRSFAYEQCFGSYGGEAGGTWWPTDLALSRDGKRLLVVDADGGRLAAFSTDGRFHRYWSVGEDPAAVWPAGVAWADDGGWFVTDRRRHRVLRYGADGELREAWGKRGLGAGAFFKPRGIGIGRDGEVFVIDWGNHRGQVFTPDGTFVDAFGPRAFVDPAKRPHVERKTVEGW